MNAGGALRWLRAGSLLAVGCWGLLVAMGRASWGFLDGVNLIFHEAGHPLFSLGGHFLGILGGSAMQVLVPAACAIAFLWQGQPFGAGLCGIWTGQSLVGVSIYMADARAQNLPLLGGDDVIHDWNYLLGRLGLLGWDKTLGGATAFLAGLLIAASAVLAALACLRPPRTEAGSAGRNSP
jgi:hypothetical protein